MENAAEALKMAGAVLLFVLALSIIIFSFGQARESADTILDYRDRETAYIDTNYYYTQTVNSDGSINTERSVGLETIIPTIYKYNKAPLKLLLSKKNTETLIAKINPELIWKLKSL